MFTDLPSMIDLSEPVSFAPANDAEKSALETAWASGRLQSHAVRILNFIDRHREEILHLAGSAPASAMQLRTVKRQIVHLGSVCTVSEMHDQAREIRDEIWIRGERGDYDRAHIAHEWASRHAAAWRVWRLKEYLFVVDRCADAILAHLEGAP
jgi:hypothetical protein